MTKFEGATAHFKDGREREFDAVILCTGYQHHFPFLADELRLRTTNRLWPGGLYKGVLWIDDPNLAYLGMQDQYYTFSMFDAQAWYVRDVILGRIELPSRNAMEADSAAWRKREEALEDPIQDIDFQTDYCKDLSAPTDYEIDWDVQSDNFKHWEHHKEEDIATYRDHAHRSPVTGTKAPTHHTTWWDALDDSLETFMNNPISPPRPTARGAPPSRAITRIRGHQGTCEGPSTGPPAATRSTAPSSRRQSLKPAGRSALHRSSRSDPSGRPSPPRDENIPPLSGQPPVAFARKPVVGARVLRLEAKVERRASRPGDRRERLDPPPTRVPERERFLEPPRRRRRLARPSLGDAKVRHARGDPQIAIGQMLPREIAAAPP